MKVVAKFAIAFFAASVLALSIFTYVLANREAVRLERGFAAGLTSFGGGLRNALESAWREDGYGAAERIVGGFDPRGEVHASLVREPTEGADVARGAVVIERDTRGALLRVRTAVAGPEGERAALILERPLLDGESILRAELGDQILAAAALAAAMAVLAVVLGGIVIGGPLGRIVAQARRIGEGDFSQRLRSTGNDEIGVLKRELNAMCDRLVAANARIEEESAGRIETLEKLRHLDRLRTVGTIASGIAHELGTPLNVLLLRGQALARETLDPVEVRDAGAAVLSQVEKMSRIVRQLLDFSRARQKPQGASVEELDLAEVARHASSLLASLAKKQGVTIVVEERERVTTQGDFRQIEQALTNLIVNGIQAMPEGGELLVRVGPALERGGALIEVVDEGEGMSNEVKEMVFEPFFTTKPTSDGTGLGLHVARGIAEDHGGSITVTSEKGRGSTFALRLPRCE